MLLKNGLIKKGTNSLGTSAKREAMELDNSQFLIAPHYIDDFLIGRTGFCFHFFITLSWRISCIQNDKLSSINC